MRDKIPTITVKKDIKEIKKKLIEKNTETLMVIGCGICARISKTGGPRETKKMKEILIKNGFKILKNNKLPDTIEEGLCNYSAVKKLAEDVDNNSFDSILVLGCGAGLKCILDNFKNKKIIAGLNTVGVGVKGRLTCVTCGDCNFDNGCIRL